MTAVKRMPPLCRKRIWVALEILPGYSMPMSKRRRVTFGALSASANSLLVALGAAALVGCGGRDEPADAGNLSVLLEAEETVEGIAAGDGLEDIRDGWSVSFEKYILVVGNITLQLATDPNVQRAASELFAVDLALVPESALPLWELNELAAERWVFNYELSSAGPAQSVQRHMSVSEADFSELRDNDWTYLIQGQATKTDGRACPPMARANPPAGATSVGMDTDGNPCYSQPSVSFRFGVSAATTFNECESDGVVGVAVPDGTTGTVAATIHGDHMFFNGFPEGEEGGVMRLAQWMADSDLNLDGQLGRDELEGLSVADLAVIDERYELTGTEGDIDDMWDLLVEQLESQGHMDGEGECSRR